MNIAFFGCWSPERLGHFLYNENGRTLDSFGPFIPESLDGVLLRCGSRIGGQVDLTYFKDYVVMAFIDQTADRRPGSNACFIIEGYYNSRREIWKHAEQAFPDIVRRLHGHIRGAHPEQRFD